MKALALFAFLSGAPALLPASSLTFDEAVALAQKMSVPAEATSFESEIAALKRSRLPSVRAEVMANTSRTLDLFSEGPLQSRYATSVLAFDYPLWDGGATRMRLESVEGKLRRMADRRGMDDARFAQLLDAFGELYLTQQLSEMLRPLYEDLSTQDSRSTVLMSAGEITNLTAVERRETALWFRTRLLDLEARRVEAAARLRMLTGVEPEPRLLLDLSESAPAMSSPENVSDDFVRMSSVAVEESRARLREVRAFGSFRSTLSGFVGFGSAESRFAGASSAGSFGVYGLRVLFSYPLLRGTSDAAIIEARADLEQSLATLHTATIAAETRATEYKLRADTATTRISLLKQSVEAAKERQVSLQRLVKAGLRAEGELTSAQAEQVRRESDVLAAEIERWKASRLLARMLGAGDSPHP